MRRDAVLGAAVHVVGADLDLDRLAARPDHRGVQGLVEVELRHRDVVLEPARDRVPSRVQGTEGGVAVTHAVHEDPDPDEIIDVCEVTTADDHLLVDRVVVLGAARDHRLDLRVAQVRGHLLAHDRQVLLARRCTLGDEVHDLVVHLGVEHRERQVLELPLDRVHAETVSQRRVDLERLARLALRGLRRHELPRPRVVQPVRQLDHQDADVARHRDHHLADGLGLRSLAEGDLVELRDTVDEHRNLGPEVGAELLERVVGVLDRVVQQRGDQRRRCHAELGENGGHGDRVRDVRVTALAELSAVSLLGHGVGALDDRQVGLGLVGPDHLEERLENRRPGGAAGTEAHES
ncbi:hypothetical protein GALL_373060 [mine drainage metagenome]|uniref:Uncharacterized protein n=1 Tax=mine drainage metagenome TaxID=410659 RepID=A0A1J5QLW7_9ZZZZ